MRVIVVGGGPAGLAFALFFKRQQPSADVTVVDRRQPNETYGWGITLPRWTHSRLEQADAEVGRQLADRSVSWNQFAVWHQGRCVELAGAPLLGIDRTSLLAILHARCCAVGVDVRFGTPILSDDLPDCDLLVMANGARSATREQFASTFGTRQETSANQFTWLGTPHHFPGLVLAFAETAAGVFIGHGYPFSDTMSTFVVECPPAVWQNTGLGDKSSDEARAYLAAAFADVLRGEALVSHRAVRWSSFLRVSNDRWHRDRVVLIGDAAHAIHFSVGSGTMLAVEDALALADAIGQTYDIEEALVRFEEERRPAIAAMQRLETMTLSRLEGVRRDIDIPPLSVVYDLLRPMTNPSS